MCFSALIRAKLEELEQEAGAKAVASLWAQLYETDRTDPGKIKFVAGSEGRLFPGILAPVIRKDREKLWIEPMIYSAWAPAHLKSRNLTSYNARRDNLTSPFWASAFGKGHGMIIMKAFYEWVAVRDLLKAGVIVLSDVEAEFDRQSELRRKKIIAAGKSYKKTKTELKPPIDRKIIIEFRPEKDPGMLVPVIFNQDPEGRSPYKGFAIVTDDPPEEVEAAGHDRCPVILNHEAMTQWLSPETSNESELIKLLTRGVPPKLSHTLDQAS